MYIGKPLMQMSTQREKTDEESRMREATETELSELKGLTAPIVAWIRENHDPHTEVHISWDHVWVKRDALGIPFPYSEV